MRVTYKTPTIDFVFDCPDLKAAFADIGQVEEIFGHRKCGHCQSENVRPLHRRHDDFDFYSMECQDCRHELKFGQRREDGGLFPKTYDSDTKMNLIHGGWLPPFKGRAQHEERDTMKTNRDPAPPLGEWPQSTGPHAPIAADDIPF